MPYFLLFSRSTSYSSSQEGVQQVVQPIQTTATRPQQRNPKKSSSPSIMEPFFHDNFEEYLVTNKSTHKVDYALAAELRDIGLQLANSTCQSVMVQDRRFRSHYGLNWVQASLIWQRILPIVVDYYAHKKPKKKHLFYALRFLKTYDTETNGSSFFKCDEKTLRAWTWKYVEAISLLEGELVRKNVLIIIYFISHSLSLSYQFCFSIILNI